MYKLPRGLRRCVLLSAVLAGFVPGDGSVALAQLTGGVQPSVTNPVVVRVVGDAYDATVRRTDAAGAFWPYANRPPIDLLRYKIGLWSPTDPASDRYRGVYDIDGGFVRIDLVFDGVVNPPGPTSIPSAPQRYGPSPVYGWVELDIDKNVNTGGEVTGPEYRYNGAVARFGGRPTGRVFTDRISIDGRESDGILATPPWIDRSGEEFHLALLGGEIVDIVDLNGDGDLTFDEGEAWLLRGYFFHRAHGYRDLTFGGRYEPLVELCFTHHIDSDNTIISMVYPLTNLAYADASNTFPQAEDGFASNANSIREGLLDLHLSAMYGASTGHTYQPLIDDWADQDPDDYLEPSAWRVTMVFGTVLTTNEVAQGLYTYTDVWPDVVPGDFNGDGLASQTDARMAASFVATHDGDLRFDADGRVNGEVAIVGFGPRFSIFDVDYDGLVDDFDLRYSEPEAADGNNDGWIDLRDFAVFQRCYAAEVAAVDQVAPTGCLDLFDLDLDKDIDGADYALFISRMMEP